ncbi:hypothetical protein YC2023_020163 [Brassica napus]
MKYGKKIDVLKLQTLFPQIFLGNYRGYTEETWFLGIFSFNRVKQAAEYFEKIELMISEEILMEIFNYSEEMPTDIFRRTLHFIRSNQIFFPISLFLSPPNLSFCPPISAEALLLSRDFRPNPPQFQSLIMYEPYPTILC